MWFLIEQLVRYPHAIRCYSIFFRWSMESTSLSHSNEGKCMCSSKIKFQSVWRTMKILYKLLLLIWLHDGNQVDVLSSFACSGLFYLFFLSLVSHPALANVTDFNGVPLYVSLAVGCVRVIWKSIFNLNPFFSVRFPCVCEWVDVCVGVHVSGCEYVVCSVVSLIFFYWFISCWETHWIICGAFLYLRSFFARGFAKHITWLNRPSYSPFILFLFIDFFPIPSINIQVIL